MGLIIFSLYTLVTGLSYPPKLEKNPQTYLFYSYLSYNQMTCGERGGHGYFINHTFPSLPFLSPILHLLPLFLLQRLFSCRFRGKSSRKHLIICLCYDILLWERDPKVIMTVYKPVLLVPIKAKPFLGLIGKHLHANQLAWAPCFPLKHQPPSPWKFLSALKSLPVVCSCQESSFPSLHLGNSYSF